MKIFNKADDEDRNGLATQKTAKTFHAASLFLELLKTFGELDEDVEII
jgi:vacuolar protein sorting-associated protein VTA1